MEGFSSGKRGDLEKLPLLETQFDPRMRYLNSALMKRYRELYNVGLVHHVAGIMLNKVDTRNRSY